MNDPKLRRGARYCLASALALIAPPAFPHADALEDPRPEITVVAPPVETRDHGLTLIFDPLAEETLAHGTVGDDLCVTFFLPMRWHLAQDGPKPHLRTETADAELELEARSRAELPHAPLAGLAARHAAALEQEYEALLGKPVQSTTLTPIGAEGGTRWSATWFDDNLPGDSGALSVDTLIVPDAEASLGVTIVQVENAESRDLLLARIASTLQVGPAVECNEATSSGR